MTEPVSAPSHRLRLVRPVGAAVLGSNIAQQPVGGIQVAWASVQLRTGQPHDVVPIPLGVVPDLVHLLGPPPWTGLSAVHCVTYAEMVLAVAVGDLRQEWLGTNNRLDLTRPAGMISSSRKEGQREPDVAATVTAIRVLAELHAIARALDLRPFLRGSRPISGGFEGVAFDSVHDFANYFCQQQLVRVQLVLVELSLGPSPRSGLEDPMQRLARDDAHKAAVWDSANGCSEGLLTWLARRGRFQHEKLVMQLASQDRSSALMNVFDAENVTGVWQAMRREFVLAAERAPETPPSSPLDADDWRPIAVAAERAGLTLDTVRNMVRRKRGAIEQRQVGGKTHVRLADVVADRNAKQRQEPRQIQPDRAITRKPVPRSGEAT